MNIKKRMRKNAEKNTFLKATMSMIYQCEKCGKRRKMFLQEGLEDHSENHKPVPYAIRCTCGGNAFHVDWDLDEYYDPPVLITENVNYFKNNPKRDCGQPMLR